MVQFAKVSNGGFAQVTGKHIASSITSRHGFSSFDLIARRDDAVKALLGALRGALRVKCWQISVVEKWHSAENTAADIIHYDLYCASLDGTRRLWA